MRLHVDGKYSVFCCGLGTENVLVDFGNQCFNHYTIFSNSFFYKIHDSCHNFLHVCKAEHMFLSTGLVFIESTVCSRCPRADFIAPVTMSQIGHVFGGFFPSNIVNTQIKLEKYVIIFLNIIYLLQLTHENHQHSIFY